MIIIILMLIMTNIVIDFILIFIVIIEVQGRGTGCQGYCKGCAWIHIDFLVLGLQYLTS